MEQQPLKILFVTRSYPPVVGGMETFAFELHQSLAEKAQVKLIAARGRGLKLVLLFMETLVFTLFRSQKFDVVYANDLLTNFFCLPAKLLWKKPLVASVHGLDLVCLRKQKKNPVSALIKIIYKILILLSSRHVDTFLPNSSATAGLLEIIGCQGRSTYVLSPGIQSEHAYRYFPERATHAKFLRQSHLISDDRRILLVLGRLVRRKGALWFMENVFCKMKEPYHLFIAGHGPDFDTLIQLKVAGIDTFHHVTLLGEVSDEEKWRLLSGADLTILPNIKISDDWEGFGIVAAESAAVGTPVVGASLEGLTTAVRHGETGFQYPPGDADACLAAISSAGQLDPGEVSTRAITHFSYEKIAANFIDFLVAKFRTNNKSRALS
jgi:phosphatidylinositol alpha-1,6-mannosyltransferase